MNIDLVLAGLEDDDPVPVAPSQNEYVRMDAFFENSDFGLDQTDADDEVIMKLPRGKVVKVSRQRLRSCKNDAESRALDREIYVGAGLNPTEFGL